MAFLSPDDASLLIGAIQFAFGLLVWAAVIDMSTRMPRTTSVPTAVGLWGLAAIFMAMGPLLVATATTTFCAAGWTALAVLRAPGDAQDRVVRKMHILARRLGDVGCNYCDGSLATALVHAKSGTIACSLDSMIAADLAAHKETDNCGCPFPCPECGKTTHWDMALEGHFCTGCEWYDGVK